MTTPEEAKDVIRRWNNEGWSGGKYDLAYEIIAPVMTVHGAGGQPVEAGPDGLIDLIKTWRTAFPDGEMTIDDLIVDGDLVGIRNTWHGTHTGEFYGIPPSGKRVAVTSIGLDRVKDGQVVEGWGELDMVGMMQTLGAMPMAGPGAVAAGASSDWGETRSSGRGADGDTKAVAVRFVEAVAAGEAIDALVTPDFVDHNPVWGTTDAKSVATNSAMLRAAMPDLRVEIEKDNLVAEGDQVLVHSIYRGTHSGDLLGTAGSGKELVWTHTDFVRIADGRVVERWVSADTLTLFQQAGVLPGGS